MIAATVLVAVAATPALAVARPDTVTAPLKVFAPANVCVPVDTVPRLEASASGIFRFKVLDERAKPIAAADVVIASE